MNRRGFQSHCVDPEASRQTEVSAFALDLELTHLAGRWRARITEFVSRNSAPRGQLRDGRSCQRSAQNNYEHGSFRSR